jgi:hypothetical protein
MAKILEFDKQPKKKSPLTAVVTQDVPLKAYYKSLDDGRKVMVIPKDAKQMKDFDRQIKATGTFELPEAPLEEQPTQVPAPKIVLTDDDGPPRRKRSSQIIL